MIKKNMFVAAFDGLIFVFKNERNIKIHLLAFIGAVLFGFLFQINQMEWIAILLCSLIVFVSEIINTAIEKLCDYVHPEMHSDIRKIKDLSASAVLLSAFISVVIGIVVFGPYLTKTFCDLI